MHFSNLLAAVASLATANAIAFTNSDFNGITTGVPFTLTWTGQVGLTNILLKHGAAPNPLLVDTIATAVPGSSFVWIPATSIPAGTYILELDDTGNGAVTLSQPFLFHVGVIPPITLPIAVPIALQITQTPAASTTAHLASTTAHAVPLSTGGSFANATTSTRVIFTNTTSISAHSSTTTTTSVSAHSSATGTVTPSVTSIVVSQAARYASPFALVLLGVVGVVITN